MEVGDLYQFVLLLVLVGMILGVGLITLSKFEQTSGVSATASQALNDTQTALGDISSSWLSLIVTVAVLAIILTLVIRSFAVRGRR